jgi:hypothetical protein
MINYHDELVEALNTVLPTRYEMILTSKTPIPCISYMETNNYVSTNGDTLGYSVIVYQVKVWGHSIKELNKYAMEIDEVLRPIGFTRTSTNELYDRESTMIQKIMSFEAMALEQF